MIIAFLQEKRDKIRSRLILMTRIVSILDVIIKIDSQIFQFLTKYIYTVCTQLYLFFSKLYVFEITPY